MPKNELTPEEVRAYRRLTRAAHEVERLENLRRSLKSNAHLTRHFANGTLMFGDDPRLASPTKLPEGCSNG